MKHKLVVQDLQKYGIQIAIENGSILAYAPTLELAKQEATKVLGDLQLKLLALKIECEVCRPNGRGVRRNGYGA